MFRCILMLVLFSCDVYATQQDYPLILNSTEYEALISLLPESLLENYDPSASEDTNMTYKCSSDLIILQDAIARREIWALTMLDSSSKLPSGLLRGNMFEQGQYDECSAVRGSDNDIRGLGCAYTIGKLTLSICLPASCSSDDLSALIKSISQSQALEVRVESAVCSPIKPITWDIELIVCLTLLSIWLGFLIICTIIEITRCSDEPKSNTLVDNLAKFSLRRGVVSILDVDVNESNLSAIHGIRCLCMATVVLFHTFIEYKKVLGVFNYTDVDEWARTRRPVLIFSVQYAVDTFLALSSFLMTYSFLKQISKQKKFELVKHYLYRYLRLTPAILGLMVFTIILLPKLGSGILWDKRVEYELADGCRKNCWSAFLYVHNLVDAKNACMRHLWYTSVDMQLFWLSPLILYPLYKKPKYGLILLAALLLSSTVISAISLAIQKLPGSSYLANPIAFRKSTVFKGFIQVTYHRASPWFVGMFLGYELANHDRQCSKWMVRLGWLITIASFAFCTIGMNSFLDPNYEYNAVWESIFTSVSRPIWTFAVCWIIYASVKNKAGFVSSILSYKVFIPFSKLSYCIYIIHRIVIVGDRYASKTPAYFSEYYLWHSFLANLMISIAAAFLLSLFFETPAMVLAKILMRKKSINRRSSITKMSSNTAEIQ